MSNASMTPGSRPRKGVIAVAAIAMAVAATGLAVAIDGAASPSRVAGAAELSTFDSCADMAEWGRQAQGGAVGQADDVTEELLAVGGAVADAPATSRFTTEGTDSAAGGSGAVAPNGNAAGEDGTNVAVAGVDELDLLDRLDADRILVASMSRLAIVDLARAEVVASRSVPYDAQVTYDAESGVAWVVGQDETRGGIAVDRVTVTDAGMTTDGTWTTSGILVDARRVGDRLHVVATEGFSVDPVPGVPVPEVGRDDLGGSPGGPASGSVGAVALPFSDGPVPCDEVLHPAGPSDPMATLIVTLPATGAVEPERAAEVVGAGEQVHVTPEAAYVATPEYTGSEVATGIHRFDLDTLAPTGSGRVEGLLLNQFSLSEAGGYLRAAVTTGSDVVGVPTPLLDAPAADVAVPPPVPGGEPRNEVVVLDTEGDLDVVGRTDRFGKPGESIHGIRFVGDVAYAVTFLTTDPFYVIDLATPSAPRVVGEVELPGFSAYLHPLSDDLVVGFGPGADGRAEAKLFDVSDPTAPRVADGLVLGDESPVAWDHHAYVDLGDGRFAVPANTWSGRGGTGAVVVVDATGGRLAEVERHVASTSESVSRAIPAGEGWALLSGPRIVVLDGDGASRATLDLTA